MSSPKQLRTPGRSLYMLTGQGKQAGCGGGTGRTKRGRGVGGDSEGSRDAMRNAPGGRGVRLGCMSRRATRAEVTAVVPSEGGWGVAGIDFGNVSAVHESQVGLGGIGLE